LIILQVNKQHAPMQTPAMAAEGEDRKYFIQ
jgi:hypothetical protein